MARMLGTVPLLRYALGWLTLRAALDALERRCDTRLAVVEMPFGAAAVDVDKPADLLLAERWLSAQAG
jgi:CTP:molybdopterin cytidylyltransferase MocA